MEQVNPGIAKGYALDFASPLRFVAEQLHAGPRTLDELAERYEHERDDLARVWDHELRERGQRRSAREQVQAQRETDAKRWLIEAAIAALGTQLRQDGDRFALAVPIEAIRFRGIPVVMPATPTEGRTASQRSKRARTGRGGAPAAE
ncbi:MAG: hypothetical protein O3B31_08865, partial [Chloroflexi bacterium]|nr:hypothetical protein [Chloroflexota bacterium]